MAAKVLVQLTIVQRNGYNLAAPEIWAVPVGAFIATPYTGDVANVESQIFVAPTGLNQRTQVLLCSETVSEIATSANG
jgi:hypothetical protein